MSNTTIAVAATIEGPQLLAQLPREARGDFGQLTDNYTPPFARKLIEELDGDAYELGIESDRKLRGSSVNADVYSYDLRQGLAVIQVRQCIFRPGRFNQVKKDYFLIGRNENGEPFAHPVDVRAAGRVVSEDPAAGIRMALMKIWGVKERELTAIRRNGDTAFVPVKELPENARELDITSAVVRDSHHVRALKGARFFATGQTHVVPTEPLRFPTATAFAQDIFRMRNEGKSEEEINALAEKRGSIRISDHEFFTPFTYYIQGPASIKHTKGQHPTTRTNGSKRQIWRIATGTRTLKHGFARPTAD